MTDLLECSGRLILDFSSEQDSPWASATSEVLQKCTIGGLLCSYNGVQPSKCQPDQAPQMARSLHRLNTDCSYMSVGARVHPCAALCVDTNTSH